MYHKAFALAGLNWISFNSGYAYGQSSGLVSFLQKKEEGINLNEGEISLIASSFTMVCVIGFFISAIITDRLGRRWPFIIFSATSVISWIILYYSEEMLGFMSSRIIGGISSGALICLNIYVPSEYTTSRTRVFYLNMITTAAPSFGMALVHAIGIVLHFRTVALIGMSLTALQVLLPFSWVESPHWLASKGRFEECETAFRTLHGQKSNSERELQLLLKMERSKLARASETNSKPTLKRLFMALKKKYFWGLLILSIVIHAYYTAAGKLLFTVLATVILEQIAGTTNVLLFTLLVDGFIIIGSCMSCFLIKKTTLRTLLFSTGFTANALLVLFAICFYFKNGESYFDWINIVLLALYFIIVNAGPYPAVEAILSEMFPLELKIYMHFISGITLITFLSSSIMLYPYTVASIGYHGLFLTNAAAATLCLGYIWLYLPDTKDKTLQEIELYFKTNNFDLEQMLSNAHTTKSLI